MARDRIVEQVRRNRERYFARFGFDLDALYRDLTAREARGEYTTVRRTARRPRQIKRTGS